MRSLLSLGALLLAALPTSLQARDYGQRGAVFPVIERDLLEQIHSRLAAMEASGETARLNQELKRRTIARVNRPYPIAGLIHARAKPAAGPSIRRSRLLPISAEPRAS